MPAGTASAAPGPAPAAAGTASAAADRSPALGRKLRLAIGLGLSAEPGVLAVQVALLICAGALPVLAAWLTKLLFDALVSGGARDAAWYAVGAALAGAATAVSAGVAGYLGARRHRSVGLLVQDRLYERSNRHLGLRPFEDPRRLGRLRLAEEAAAGAPQAITGFALELVQAMVSVFGFVGVLITVWPPMVVLLLLGAVPTVLAQLALARRQAGVVEQSMESVRRRLFYQTLLTDVRAAQEVRLFGLAGLFSGRMARLSRSVAGRGLAVERRATIVHGGLSLFTAAVGAIGSVAVLLAVGAGSTSVGDFVLFVAAVAALQGAVTAVATGLGDAVQGLRLFENYLHVLQAPDDLPSGSRPCPALRQGLQLRDVWFRYGPDLPWVLRGVTLAIERGSTVGLVGLNGAGKSTLVKLLCRFYDPDRGAILWDGVDLRELDAAALRRRLGVTFQDFMQYDMTAAENIGLGDAARLDDHHAIRHAARLAEVHDTLDALPRGYDTLLSRVFFDDEQLSGASLSGGQWQRVAVARALFRDGADLLVMDEPSSGLDARAEHHIHEVLRAHRVGRTCVLISHRLNAIRGADRIVVLRDGVVAEEGDHESLMLGGGEYARLFALQAKLYQDARVGA
jgi:ATP-binding cassette subfamily B protein